MPISDTNAESKILSKLNFLFYSLMNMCRSDELLVDDVSRLNKWGDIIEIGNNFDKTIL